MPSTTHLWQEQPFPTSSLKLPALSLNLWAKEVNSSQADQAAAMSHGNEVKLKWGVFAFKLLTELGFAWHPLHFQKETCCLEKWESKIKYNGNEKYFDASS